MGMFDRCREESTCLFALPGRPHASSFETRVSSLSQVRGIRPACCKAQRICLQHIDGPPQLAFVQSNLSS